MTDKQDAKRYQWLRSQPLDDPEIWIAVDSAKIPSRWALGGDDPDGCDAAIDAAMGAKIAIDNGFCTTTQTELQFLRTKLKTGEYDGVDIMQAWLAIDELMALREWQNKAFEAHPNLDLDIENLE